MSRGLSVTHFALFAGAAPELLFGVLPGSISPGTFLQLGTDEA